MPSAVQHSHLAELVVYTCIAGAYDRLRTVPQAEAGVSYVCFAERGTRVPPPWQRLDPLPLPDGQAGSHNVNRYHKLFPHRLFPGQRYSIYQDGNVSFRGSFLQMLERFRQSGAAVGAYQHFDQRTVESEARECIQCGKFNASDLELIGKQLATYRAAGYPMAQPISANYVLVRDHWAEGFDAAMEGTWHDLQRYTSRDQISLGFNLWQNSVSQVFLDELGIPLERAKRHLHRNEFFRERLPGYLRRRYYRLMDFVSSGKA